MTLPTATMLYTPEDLLTLPDYGRFELLDGHLVERKMGAQSSYAATNVLILIGALRTEQQARTGLSSGLWLSNLRRRSREGPLC